MKRSMRYVLVTICLLLSAILFGCATIKEAAKGFAGVSTKILEEKRKEAIKESFAIDYSSCYAKVKDILREKDKESPVYAEDAQKKMIGVYFSETDTTPVGVFFTEEAKGSTMVEISSPSTYAKEYIANRVFSGINALVKPREDKKANVK